MLKNRKFYSIILPFVRIIITLRRYFIKNIKFKHLRAGLCVICAAAFVMSSMPVSAFSQGWSISGGRVYSSKAQQKMWKTSGSKTFKATLTKWEYDSDCAEVQLFHQINYWPDTEISYLDNVFDSLGQSKKVARLANGYYYFLAGPQSGRNMSGTTYLN